MIGFGGDRGLVHHESAYIMEELLLPLARRLRYDLVVDVVGKTSSKMVDWSKLFHSAGYRVSALHVDTPTPLCLLRALQRFRRTGRYVDLEYIRGMEGAHDPRNTYRILRELLRRGIVSGGRSVSGETGELIDQFGWIAGVP